MADPTINAVHIATPMETHYDLACEALSEHKHILLEKPMAMNARDAFKIARLAEKNGNVVLVGHIFRFNAALVRAKELLDRNAIVAATVVLPVPPLPVTKTSRLSSSADRGRRLGGAGRALAAARDLEALVELQLAVDLVRFARISGSRSLELRPEVGDRVCRPAGPARSALELAARARRSAACPRSCSGSSCSGASSSSELPFVLAAQLEAALQEVGELVGERGRSSSSTVAVGLRAQLVGPVAVLLDAQLAAVRAAGDDGGAGEYQKYRPHAGRITSHAYE